MSPAKLIACYALLGPLIGAIVVVLGGLATEPALRDGWLQFVTTVLVFSYPLGVLPAIAAGVAHAWAAPRLGRWVGAAGVCSCAVVATMFVAWLIGNPATIVQSPLALFAFVLPPVVSGNILYWTFRTREP